MRRYEDYARAIAERTVLNHQFTGVGGTKRTFEPNWIFCSNGIYKRICHLEAIFEFLSNCIWINRWLLCNLPMDPHKLADVCCTCLMKSSQSMSIFLSTSLFFSKTDDIIIDFQHLYFGKNVLMCCPFCWPLWKRIAKISLLLDPLSVALSPCWSHRMLLFGISHRQRKCIRHFWWWALMLSQRYGIHNSMPIYLRPFLLTFIFLSVPKARTRCR